MLQPCGFHLLGLSPLEFFAISFASHAPRFSVEHCARGQLLEGDVIGSKVVIQLPLNHVVCLNPTFTYYFAYSFPSMLLLW